MEKTKSKNSDSQNQMLILGAVVAVVAFVALLVIILQPSSLNLSGDYADIAKNRTDDGAFILGDPEAPVTVVIFEDFLCPHCQAYQDTVHQFIEQYVRTGMARFEFRMLPTAQYSAAAFGLAQCADEIAPGAFWTAHDTLFNIASGSGFTPDNAEEFANELGLNYTELLNCQRTADQYLTDQSLARSVGIQGTPSLAFRTPDGSIAPLTEPPNIGELGVLIEAQQANR